MSWSEVSYLISILLPEFPSSEPARLFRQLIQQLASCFNHSAKSIFEAFNFSISNWQH